MAATTIVAPEQFLHPVMMSSIRKGFFKRQITMPHFSLRSLVRLQFPEWAMYQSTVSTVSSFLGADSALIPKEMRFVRIIRKSGLYYALVIMSAQKSLILDFPDVLKIKSVDDILETWLQRTKFMTFTDVTVPKETMNNSGLILKSDSAAFSIWIGSFENAIKFFGTDSLKRKTHSNAKIAVLFRYSI